MGNVVACKLFKIGGAHITWAYGEVDSKGKKHNGIDLTADTSDRFDWITAHSDGVVKEVRDGAGAEPGGSYGNYVILDHGDSVYTVYAHMKKGSVKVAKGDKVKAGDILGYMGKSGTCEGAHLHFELRVNGKKVDPTIYINDFLPSGEEEPEIVDIEYTVKKGDSYWAIAKMAKSTYGATIKYTELKKYAKNPAHIHPGDKILIPVPNPKLTDVINEGSLVQVKAGAKNTGGVKLASWVYSYTFIVLETPENNKAKIGKIVNGKKKKTATMYLKDLIKVK